MQDFIKMFLLLSTCIENVSSSKQLTGQKMFSKHIFLNHVQCCNVVGLEVKMKLIFLRSVARNIYSLTFTLMVKEFHHWSKSALLSVHLRTLDLFHLHSPVLHLPGYGVRLTEVKDLYRYESCVGQSTIPA